MELSGKMMIHEVFHKEFDLEHHRKYSYRGVVTDIPVATKHFTAKFV